MTIPDFGSVEEVRDQYTTLLWYIGKREGIDDSAREMELEEKVSHMRSVGILANLDQEILEELAGSTRLKQFGRREWVIHQGDPGKAMYIIVAGSESILINRDGEEIEVAQIGAGTIFSLDGIPLLLNLFLYVSAAGLGASFAGLYKANQYITNGTFDPAYSASYWIRFFLGLISGLMLAVLISKNTMEGITLLEDGVIRPLLGIVGGFSADLLYTFLSRMVESLKSLFEGSVKQAVDLKVQEMQARMKAQGRVNELISKIAAN